MGVSGVDESPSGVHTVVFSTVYETSPRDSHYDRLRQLGDEYASCIDTYVPNHVALEGLFSGNNKPTIVRVAEVVGMLAYIAHTKNIAISSLNPAHIKTALCGNGRASKGDVRRMIMRLARFEGTQTRLDDEYDAVGVALTHLARRRYDDLLSTG